MARLGAATHLKSQLGCFGGPRPGLLAMTNRNLTDKVNVLSSSRVWLSAPIREIRGFNGRFWV
jgi:hypothetical protein